MTNDSECVAYVTPQIANSTAHLKTPHYSGVFDPSYIFTTYPYLTIKPTMADAANQRTAAEELSPGDHVEWGAPIRGGKATGEVVEILTEDTDVKSNHFKASESNPKVRVKSEKSGKEAVHKPTSVHKV